eukprot:1200831-Amphidinium_carterae.2
MSAVKGVMLKVLQNQSCNNVTMRELFDIYGDLLYMIMSRESVQAVLTAPEGASVMELEKQVYELVSSSSAGRKLFGSTWKKVIAGKVDELLVLLAGRMMGKNHIKVSDMAEFKAEFCKKVGELHHSDLLPDRRK